MKPLLSYFSKNIHQDVTSLLDRERNVTVSGLAGYSSKSFIISDYLTSTQKKYEKVVWIANSKPECELMAREMFRWDHRPVYSLDLTRRFEFEPQEIEVVQSENIRRDRIATVRFLSHFFTKERCTLVLPFFYLNQDFPHPDNFRDSVFHISPGQKISPLELFDLFISNGYQVCSRMESLEPGFYFRTGDTVALWPANFSYPVRIDVEFDDIRKIYTFDPVSGDVFEEMKVLDIYSLSEFESQTATLVDYLHEKTLVVEDELDITDELYDAWNVLMENVYKKSPSVSFVLFNEDTTSHLHLHYLSFLKYHTVYDFLADIRDKIFKDWRIFIFTKNRETLEKIFSEHNIQADSIFLFSEEKDETFPFAFQNPQIKVALFTDREVSFLKEDKKKVTSQKVFLDFMSGLKVGDYVVHVDHGIARFLGLEQRKIDDFTREYLKLGYAENDKLFVPIEQADKVNKYITNEDSHPHLTRLGSAEWDTVTARVKKETEKIAQELLKLYAERKTATGFGFSVDNDLQEKFEEAFPYEETPGQMKAIIDVKNDMERPIPMDRLVCGDVGFGKTEVAVRAAFKAVQAGKQVAFISPITILADQHFRVFVRRTDGFHVRVEMLSRFKSPKEQKDILRRLEKGEVDVVIGTHRLLQSDVHFKDLGLVIVDEEQRFGVQQKEKLKQFRKEVDILTLTATPIPRTLNICLNKLRDISTITTPPPGRLPIITEVRKFSLELIREVILRELQRGGQVYFLHNRVQTIDSMADKLKALIPEARFVVTHGKLRSDDLEKRILDFKDHQYDVLVSSTIIENGIDLPNANTLIVNNAERFGLAQLYQLRGRVGRGKTQAYAYLLYHGQRLKLDAKRRLKAIVEASELGAGFQIAMKDLEIRGAGEVLGVKQHGAINVVGVGHFIRMLNKAVEDLQAGRLTEARGEEAVQVSVELPLTCYIPDSYIVSAKDKINIYQRMASVDSFEYLDELKEDVLEEYGRMPKEVMNLFLVLELKIHARQAGVVTVKAENIQMSKDLQEITLLLSKSVKPENIMSLLGYNSHWQISGNKLRVKLSDLGMNWVEELRESLVALGKKITVGK